MRCVLALVMVMASALGCAREGTSVQDPGDVPRWTPARPGAPQGLYAPSFASGWGVPPAWYAPPPPVVAEPVGATRRLASETIPPGEPCIAYLARIGVAFERKVSVKGVQTPVRVVGPIGGIPLRAVAGLDVVCDCRLAVALAWAAPELTSLGVRELRYSGAYVDRRTRAGRPSLHARGLAIDIHAMRVGHQIVSVEQGFERGVEDGCRPDAPVLNQAACRLKRLGLFKELLTPDDNYDHHDHFHMGIAPLSDGAHDAAGRAQP
jgi:hypothetical protein